MSNVALGEAYFKSMAKKDAESMSKCLHPDVQFFGPLSSLSGKNAVMDAARKLFTSFNHLSIVSKLGDDMQAVIIYDLDFHPPVGNFRVAAHMTFSRGLIDRIELFYDARPFEVK